MWLFSVQINKIWYKRRKIGFRIKRETCNIQKKMTTFNWTTYQSRIPETLCWARICKRWSYPWITHESIPMNRLPGIDYLESIPGFFKILKIPPLESQKLLSTTVDERYVKLKKWPEGILRIDVDNLAAGITIFSGQLEYKISNINVPLFDHY